MRAGDSPVMDVINRSRKEREGVNKSSVADLLRRHGASLFGSIPSSCLSASMLVSCCCHVSSSLVRLDPRGQARLGSEDEIPERRWDRIPMHSLRREHGSIKTLHTPLWVASDGLKKSRLTKSYFTAHGNESKSEQRINRRGDNKV